MREKLTYANVMATIAVFLTLAGGVAYAASQLPKNSVGPKQLRKNAVTGAKVKDHSLRGVDLNLKSLGTVPSATEAGHATSANRATAADRAELATQAGNAANAETLGGVGPAGYLAASELLRFSAAMDVGDPDQVLGTLGPLTFIASCSEPPAQTRAVIKTKTSAGPVFVNGFEVFPAGIRELAVTASSDSDAYTAELVAAVSTVEPFAADGSFTSIVNTSDGDCRFVGHLLRDAG